MGETRIQRTMMRRIVTSMAALMAVLSLAGCAAGPQDCSRPEVRCAGLVTDFGSVDEGISREAWLALQDVRSAGLLERADFVETVDSRDRAANIAVFGDAAYDVIVTAGAGITDETLAAAEALPTSYFIGVQQAPEGRALPDNYAMLVFHDEQSGFLAGAVAGLMTESGRVAAVCEAEFIDSVRRTCDGFRQGARHANPEIQAEVSYRTGAAELIFRDRTWGAETAGLSIDRGADVVFSIGEETADAALIAAAERGVLVIGSETDQYHDLPEVRTALVTSAILDIRGGLQTLLEEAVEGRLRAGTHWGEIGLAPFREFAARLPPGAMGRLMEMADQLRTGAIRLESEE